MSRGRAVSPPLALLGLLFLLLAQSALSAPEGSTLAVRFCDGSLSAAQVADWLEFRPPSPKLAPEVAQRRRIEERVLLEVLNQRFLAAGLEKDAENQGWQGLLEDRLASAPLRRQVLAEVNVPEAEVEKAFNANPREFDSEKRFQLQNLFLRFPQPNTEKGRQDLHRDMTALRERLLAGADFAALAREHSQSATRSRGGHLGSAALRDLQPAIAAVVAELEEGEISPIVETADGLTLLRCLKVIPAQTLAPSEVKEKLRADLRDQLFEKAWQDLERRLLAKADLEVKMPEPDTALDATIATFKAGAAGVRITRRDFELFLRELNSEPFTALPPDVLRRRLDELVRQRLLRHEAGRQQLFEDPLLQRRLFFETMEMRAELMLQPEVRARLVEPKAEEIQALYERRKEQLREGSRFSFRSLTLPIRSDLPVALYHQVQTVGAQLGRRELDWAQATERLGSQMTAGEQISLTENQLFQLGRNVETAIKNLEPGQASGPHQEGRTLWLVQLLERVEQRPLSFAEARPRLRAALIASRREQIRSDLRAEIIAGQEIQISP